MVIDLLFIGRPKPGRKLLVERKAWPRIDGQRLQVVVQKQPLRIVFAKKAVPNETHAGTPPRKPDTQCSPSESV